MGLLSFSRNVGVDLGTSHTRVYVPYRGVVFDGPSVLASDKKNSVYIGNEAKEMLGRMLKDIDIRFIISHGIVQDEQVVEWYLRHIFKQFRGLSRIFRNDVLVNVPTNATNMQQRAMMQTCRRAGMRHVFTEANSVLSALGVGMDKSDLKGRMIADIGAGLTETAVISLGSASSSSTVKIGGNDMDRSIVDHIKRQYQLLVSSDTARKIKEGIGSVLQSNSPKTLRVKGGDLHTKLPRVVSITSNDVADAVRGEVDMILKAVADVFQSTPSELVSDVIERGLVLTGGVAKLHGLDVEISKHINVPVQIADDPEHAVIRGIGRSIQSGHLDFHKWVIQAK